LNPYKDGYAKNNNNDWLKIKQYAHMRQANRNVEPQPVSIPVEVLKKTLGGYRFNNFVQNLLHTIPYPFTVKDMEQVISLYYLGTINRGYRKGAVTFPFIDKCGKVRAVQVKQFDHTNHTTGTDFLHTMMEKGYISKGNALPYWLEQYIKQDKRVTCLW
jgi:hypothetical protein